MIAALAIPGSLVAGRTVPLEEDEVHHLRVRRVSEGARIRLFDGEGVIATGPLAWKGKTAEVTLASIDRIPKPAVLRLGVAAGDRERFAWLVEKGTELGVTDIVPLETDRTGGVASKLRGAQVARLRLRGREAVKQCFAAWAPVITEPQSVAEFATQALDGTRWLADARGQAPAPPRDSSAVTVAVGPEGGFTDAERLLFNAEGFIPVCLSPHLLRFETAALAAAAVVAAARPRGTHD